MRLRWRLVEKGQGKTKIRLGHNKRIWLWANASKLGLTWRHLKWVDIALRNTVASNLSLTIMENNKKKIKQRKREWSIDTTWIYLENIMLNEGSQSPKATNAWFYLLEMSRITNPYKRKVDQSWWRLGELSGSESSELRRMFLNSVMMVVNYCE